MKIEFIRLKNFKAFKNTRMANIPNLCVIVGANGSGKSTISSVFGFLKDALTGNVNTALMYSFYVVLGNFGLSAGTEFDQTICRFCGGEGSVPIDV